MNARRSLFACVLAAVLLAAVACAARSVAEDRAHFADFTRHYERHYADAAEEAHRFAVFRANLDRIDALNVAHRRATFGVNEFADLSADEFRMARLAKPLDTSVRREVPEAPHVSQATIDALPSAFDWRQHGAVTHVKNQGQCGSCWSFSATGNVEGQWFLAGHPLTSLSEQNLVDCDHNCGQYRTFNGCDAGCNGGLQPNAFRYIMANGIDTEASYPYDAVNGQCRFNPANVGARISNYTMVSTDEAQMKAYLHAHGPISIAADAAEWQFYVAGVFEGPCGTSLDHGILIVGWGVETDMFGTYKYWIVKNSWGPTWGIDGYLHIIYGEGECGLNLFASSSIISN